MHPKGDNDVKDEVMFDEADVIQDHNQDERKEDSSGLVKKSESEKSEITQVDNYFTPVSFDKP